MKPIFLLLLDAKIVAATTTQTALDAVKKAQTDLVGSNLTKEEKDKLTKMLDFFAANYAYANTGAKTSGETCEECMRRSFWVQMLVAGVTFVACMVASGGTLAPLCVAAAIGLSAASVFGTCPQCYIPPTPPPVPCKECPTSAGFGYDGANCPSNICAPSGTVAFVYGNAFYYTAKQPGNQCPIGQSYDGANCYKMPVPAGYRPFVWNRCYYVKGKCK